jgi:murein DD-endopeptidase MepM/ murein hydrolase activator NlpD
VRLRHYPVLLAGAALIGSVYIGFVPTAPAAAEVLQEEVAESIGVQTFAGMKATLPPVATPRDEFSLTMLTVVQWPVSASSTVSSGFGWRNAPCWGCSSDHQGTDLTPGGGTPIENIADGTVSAAGPIGGLGYRVQIEHTINGQHVTSIYGHMIAGSIRVSAGQTVDRGTVLGLVGNTGASTGNHLHFEIHDSGGDAVDSLAWIKANANDWMWNG